MLPVLSKDEKSVLNDVLINTLNSKMHWFPQTPAVLLKLQSNCMKKSMQLKWKLEKESHDVWMEMLPTLKEDVNKIGESKTIKFQRKYSISLSDNMYKLMKVEK